MKNASKTALCGVLSALAAAIMLVGALLGIGTYASPLLAGVALIPAGLKYGSKSQWLAFIVTALISLILVSDYEQLLMFICLFGWYPIVRPRLRHLNKTLRIIIKFALFNVIICGVEALVMLVIAPETQASWMLITLGILFNLLFVMYDKLLPRLEIMLCRRLGIKG